MRQNANQLFSQFHLPITFMGTTKLPCMSPAEMIRRSAERFGLKLLPYRKFSETQYDTFIHGVVTYKPLI